MAFRKFDRVPQQQKQPDFKHFVNQLDAIPTAIQQTKK